MRNQEIAARHWSDENASIAIRPPEQGFTILEIIDRFKSPVGLPFITAVAAVDDLLGVIAGNAVVLNEDEATISLIPRGEIVLVRFVEDNYPAPVDWFFSAKDYTRMVTALV